MEPWSLCGRDTQRLSRRSERTPRFELAIVRCTRGYRELSAVTHAARGYRTAQQSCKKIHKIGAKSCARGKRMVRNLIRVCVRFSNKSAQKRIAVGAPTQG